MFTTALKANLPVLQITTTDLINLEQVVKFYAADKAVATLSVNPEGKSPALATVAAQVIICAHDYTVSRAEYALMESKEKVLILVNQPEVSPFALDCGTLVTPKELVKAYLLDNFTPNSVDLIMP